jgi:hypothetical protein
MVNLVPIAATVVSVGCAIYSWLRGRSILRQALVAQKGSERAALAARSAVNTSTANTARAQRHAEIAAKVAADISRSMVIFTPSVPVVDAPAVKSAPRQSRRDMIRERANSEETTAAHEVIEAHRDASFGGIAPSPDAQGSTHSTWRQQITKK